MRFIMRSVREVALTHPKVAPLIARFPPRTPDALAFVEAGFRSFRRAGFDERSTARCYRALAAYSMGTLDIELGGYFSPDASDGPPTGRAEIAGATAERLLPPVTELGPTPSAQDDAAEFEHGPELLLHGFAPAVARSGRGVCTAARRAPSHGPKPRRWHPGWWPIVAPHAYQQPHHPRPRPVPGASGTVRMRPDAGRLGARPHLASHPQPDQPDADPRCR